MTAVVTDAMVDRAHRVMAGAVMDPRWPDGYLRDIAREAVTAALTDPRMCKGCTASLADMRKDAEWCSPACKMRARRALAAEQKANVAVRRPGGLQVAFGPARSALAAEFEKHGLPYPKARATAVLRRALSRRQRERFDRRNEPEEARHVMRSPKSLV